MNRTRTAAGTRRDERRGTMVAAGFVGALALAFTWPVFKQLQADSYRLLYAGRWIAHHGLPYREVFTASAHGRAFADQQWLAELIDYEAWRTAGYGGVALLMAAAFAGAFALLATVMRRRGASVVMAIACSGIAMLAGFGTTFLRAQVFALPLFVLLLWLCLADADRPRPAAELILALGVLALWANLHGSVLIGAALLCAYALAQAARMLARGHRGAAGCYGLVAAAAPLTTLATPYGTHVLVYYGHMLGNSAITAADAEWAAPAFPGISFWALVLPLVLAGAGIAATLARGIRPPTALLGAVALTAAAAALAARDTVWLTICVAVLLADTSRVWLPSRRPARRLLIALATTAGVLAAGTVGLFLARTSDEFDSQAPVRAIAATATYAAAHPCARVLADNTSASALLWFDPAIAGRVAFDGELEAYPPTALLGWVHFQLAASDHWLAAARGYPILLASALAQPRLVGRLAGLPSSSALARDGAGIAVLRTSRPGLRCRRGSRTATTHA